MDSFATITPIPPVAALDTLTYRVPEVLADRIVPGARVLVPLGRRSVTGIVTGVVETAPDGVACREVGAVLDAEPFLNPALLELARWMADYYAASIADVLSLAVGRSLTAESRRFASLAPEAIAEARTATERAIVDALAGGGEIDTRRLKRSLGGRSLDSALAALAARGVVRLDERVVEPSARALEETVVEIAGRADPALLDTLLERAPKRRQVYEYLLAQPGRRASMKMLGEALPAPGPQVAALEDAGLVRRLRHEVYRQLHTAVESTVHDRLSSDQSEAVAAISAALGTFRPFLLAGVTASGKTEVYLRVIEKVLERGANALVLVPEISLTHQVVARLVGRFGPTVAVIHSDLSPGERFDQWRRVRRRQARIVVGARSAVLAPLDDVGIVVVDEEHDAAYKQAEGIRYNGRDVAVVRARQAGCPVVLGSATPSVESWHNAQEGRYHHLRLPARVTSSPLPAIEVVDLRGRDIVATGGISEHLAQLIERNLAERGQTLLFLNRRGFAANLQCYECGAMVECDDCSVGMTLHRADERLRCHHCDATRKVPERCADCGADALVTQGLGTQRLESAVHTIVPEARIARLDRDIAGRKGATAEILTTWRKGDLDVLIGTQMVSKGHDAPGVTLVGVIHADLALGVPDFRAAERTFQLLSQVAGRAGRGERRGRVIIQTYRPDHPAIQAAVRHDYVAFAERELAERRELGYPPHARMALVRFEGKDAAAVEQLAARAARSLVGLAARVPELVVRGPAPCALERVKRRYRFQVHVRAGEARLVRHSVAECRQALAADAKRQGVRIVVDIDPIDML